MRWSHNQAAFSESYLAPAARSDARSLNTRVTDLAKPYNRLVVQPVARKWRSAVMQKLEKLVKLPNGWDGYRAQAVSFDTATFTLQMLESTCSDQVPEPQIVPGVAGDLQVEWHIENIDIELHVRAANNVSAWRSNAETGPDGEEIDLTINFLPIIGWINELVEQPANAETAA